MEGKFKRNLKPMLTYLIAGISGGLAGMMFSYCMMGPSFIKVIRPYDLNWSIPYVMFLEFFFSWLSLTVVFHNKDPRLSIMSDMVTSVASSLIGVYFSITCCMYLTGAAFSPTLALVNLPFIAYVQGHTLYLKFLPAYVIGGTLGGAFAAIYTKYFSLKY
jgi:hypothetical protein